MDVTLRSRTLRRGTWHRRALVLGAVLVGPTALITLTVSTAIPAQAAENGLPSVSLAGTEWTAHYTYTPDDGGAQGACVVTFKSKHRFKGCKNFPGTTWTFKGSDLRIDYPSTNRRCGQYDDGTYDSTQNEFLGTMWDPGLCTGEQNGTFYLTPVP